MDKRVPTEPEEPAASPGLEALAGAGLGLLVGVLTGLSVAETVGKVIAALIALLSAFLGLGGGGPDRRVRIGAFGLFCTLGIVVGLLTRTNALFSPSIEHDVKEWTNAGAKPEQALDYVAFARLGVRPADRQVGELPKAGAQSSVLFSGSNAVCNELLGMSAADQIATLRGKPAPYPQLADAATAAADPARTISERLKCGS